MTGFHMWSLDGENRHFTTAPGSASQVGDAHGNPAFILEGVFLLNLISLKPVYRIEENGLVYELIGNEQAHEASFTTHDPDGV